MQLTITNLSKTYRNGVKALDDISIEIHAGMFGLLGPNGAGKSSLMRTVATLQEPDSGSIYFNELNVFEHRFDFRKSLGYLPQDFGVYPKMSALKLLEYFAVLKGISNKKDRDEMVNYALEVTNLFDVRNKHVSGYSGGMRQRFGIAQLLLNNPQLIIVDEPTAGLDPAERMRFLNVLREIGTNHIVIFSTHIVDDVNELCTDMAIMNGGKILAHKKPEAFSESLINKVWVCETEVDELPAYEEKYEVISSGFTQNNRIKIRVFSDTKPGENFNATTSNLEDAYFVTLKSDVEPNLV